MQRPLGVTILAVLSFIGAVFFVFGGLAGLFLGGVGMTTVQQPGMGMMMAGLGAFAGVIMVALAVLYALMGYGLWKLLNWGRILALVVVALGLVAAALGLFSAALQARIGLAIWQLCVSAIDVWIIWYLTRPHVKQAFAPRVPAPSV